MLCGRVGVGVWAGVTPGRVGAARGASARGWAGGSCADSPGRCQVPARPPAPPEQDQRMSTPEVRPRSQPLDWDWDSPGAWRKAGTALLPLLLPARTPGFSSADRSGQHQPSCSHLPARCEDGDSQLFCPCSGSRPVVGAGSGHRRAGKSPEEPQGPMTSHHPAHSLCFLKSEHSRKISEGHTPHLRPFICCWRIWRHQPCPWEPPGQGRRESDSGQDVSLRGGGHPVCGQGVGRVVQWWALRVTPGGTKVGTGDRGGCQ